MTNRLKVAVVTFTAAFVVCFSGCWGRAAAALLAPTPQQLPFLESLWRRLGLAGNQTLKESKLDSALVELKIGMYHNFTSSGCPVPTEGYAGEKSGAGVFTSVDDCLSARGLAGAFGFNLSEGLTQESFSSLAVALVQQQLTGRCVRTLSESSTPASNHTETNKDIKWAYIYGTISVAIISILSCAGCVLVSCYRIRSFQHIILFLVELAIGSLVGEALLHLLPTVIENGHEHEGGGVVPPSFLKLVAAAGTICVLHAIDTGSTAAGLEGHSHVEPGQHNILPLEAVNTTSTSQAHSTSLAEGEEAVVAVEVEAVKVEVKPTEVKSEVMAQAPKTSQFSLTILHSRVRLPDLLRNPKLCLRNPVRLCLFVMLSDALHNFADGVAIGAAFALGNSDGLRLSLTIGLHELAHEIADFAVLLSCGFSVKAAALINFICTFTCFGGLYLAIPLSESSTEVQVWILAIAAAMFLYIALVTMTDLVRGSYRPKSATAFLVGNLGLITGFLSVIAISMYEIFG